MGQAGQGLRAAGGFVALVALALSLLWLTGAGAAARPAPAQDPPRADVAEQVSDSEVADGRELYLLNCASCHGLQAEGTSAGPALTDVGLASWHFYMSTGRMPLAELDTPTWEQDANQLTPAQVEAILAFAATFVSGPEMPAIVADSGDLREGWELYMNNCSSCHGVAGGGGVPGPGIVAPHLYDVTPQEIGEAIIVGPGLMPSFTYSDDQLNSIARYVLYLRNELPAPGGVLKSVLGPVAEGFVAGLLGIGALVVISRWVARRPTGELEPREKAEPLAEAERGER